MTALNSTDIKAFLDFDKVTEYRKSMGYYQIVTSELTMDPLEVIDKYHGLTQIEDHYFNSAEIKYFNENSS